MLHILHRSGKATIIHLHLVVLTDPGSIQGGIHIRVFFILIFSSEFYSGPCQYNQENSSPGPPASVLQQYPGQVAFPPIFQPIEEHQHDHHRYVFALSPWQATRSIVIRELFQLVNCLTWEILMEDAFVPGCDEDRARRLRISSASSTLSMIRSAFFR